jgi:hypothetical protein
MEKKKFIRCSCWGEGVLISKYDDESEFYLSYWREGINPMKLTFWMRLKVCGMALFKGNYFGDQVVLAPEDAKKLAEWIKERLREDEMAKLKKDLNSNVKEREVVATRPEMEQ